MIIILDDVLSNENLDIIEKNSENFNSEINGLYQWNSIEIFKPLIKICSNYYSLHNCFGYEIWEQKNTKPPNWHCDRDEILAKQNIIKYPICTLVYYINIDNLIGGKILLENGIDITPIKNRLVIFGPGVKHYVEEFSGYRHSLIINPWDKPIGLLSRDDIKSALVG